MDNDNATVNGAPSPATPAAAPVIEIVPPHGWLTVDFAELWRFRELAYFFVWRAIKIRYKQTMLGAAWAIVQPIATMLVFSLFFGHLARLPSANLPYPIFYFSGLLPWMYFSGAVQNVTNSVVEQQHVITKVYFPRLLLPISAAIPGLLDLAIGLVVLVPMMFLYHLVPGPAVLILPVFLVLAVATVLGAGLWLAPLNSLYRDVHLLVPFLVQIWMFLSPVVYPASLVPVRWRWLYGLNPMAGVIEGFRWSLTGRGQAPTVLLAVSGGAVLIVLAGGLAFFRRIEGVIADVV